MRLIFAGTPEFSVPALDALVAAGHEIAAVYTQPDRPAGRGRKLQASPVARRAETLKLPLRKPEKFMGEAIEELRALKPEAMVVVAYGLILPQAVLDIPLHGCFNIHASLLPRWRGAAPIQRAILAGDTETGITIMRMDAGLDTGPMLLQEKFAIDDVCTAGEVQAGLSVLGAHLMALALQNLKAQPETSQPTDGVTYAKKISKDEARLDWSRPAEGLARAARAYHPAPVAWTELSGERLRIHRAEARPAAAPSASADGIKSFSLTPAAASGASAGGTQPPGTVLNSGPQGIDVATGAGVLRITQLQRPGGTVLSAQEVTRGWNLDGKRFA